MHRFYPLFLLLKRASVAAGHFVERWRVRLRDFLSVALVDGKFFWLTLGGFALSFLIAVAIPSDTELSIRCSGIVLELLGLCLVALGLYKTRKRLGRPSVVAKARSWLRRMRSALQKPTEVSGHVTVGAGRATVRGKGMVLASHPPLSPTVEELLAYVVQRNKELTAQIEKVERSTDSAFEDLYSAIRVERRTRDRDFEELRTTFDDVVIGGLRLEAVGVVWLVFGTLLSSFSIELAGWLPSVCGFLAQQLSVALR